MVTSQDGIPAKRTPVKKRAPKRSPVKPIGLGHLLSHETFQHFEITDEQFDEAAQESIYGEEPDTAWDEYTSAMMRASCAFFAQEVLQGPPEEPYNGKFLIGEHHQEWDDLIADYSRICTLAPRDHGKTFMFDFAYPIWRSYYGPRTKGFIFSQTKPQAERILMDIKEELESNPKLQHLVPKSKSGIPWSNSHIQLTNGAHIYARGFGTRVRGAHPHWIVVDDGIGDETAYSETVRRKQIDYFYSAISNMLVPGGQLIVVGTPFHQADLYAELAENEEYEYRQYQALKDGVPLWPDRYPLDRLEAKRREIGPIRFDREFQCVPIADDMSLFPTYLFKGEPTEQFTLTLGMPLEFWVKHVGVVGVYMGVDFALSASVQADYTVICVIGLDKYGNRWVMEIERGKGIPYQEQLSMINRLGRLYKPGLVYLESNQAQRIFGDELIRTTDLPIKLFITGAQKNTLDKGVPSLRVLLENRKFRIPRGDKRSVELTDIWINEMRAMTFIDGKVQSVGTHDDVAMSFWICDQACRMGAFTFSFGDEDDYKPSANSPADLDSLIGIDDPASNGEDGQEPGKAAGNLFDESSFASPFSNIPR